MFNLSPWQQSCLPFFLPNMFYFDPVVFGGSAVVRWSYHHLSSQEACGLNSAMGYLLICFFLFHSETIARTKKEGLACAPGEI